MLAVTCLLMVIIAGIETIAYSVRVAAVQTGKLAVSFSLFNLIAQVSRLSLLIAFPLLGIMVDGAIEAGNVASMEAPFRYVILSITAGSILGALLIPIFIPAFVKLINRFAAVGSVPRLIFSLAAHPGVWLRPRRMRVNYRSLRRASMKNLPRSLILVNVIVVAIYTVGSLAAIYAGVLVPNLRTGTTLMAGMVNGLGAVLLMVFVDPAVAMITDEAMQGKRPLAQVKSAVFFLVSGKILGTVIAQALFLPAANWIAWLARLADMLVERVQ